MKLFILISICLLLAGCTFSNKPPTVVSTVSVGKIIDAQSITVSYRENTYTQIKTESIMVVIPARVAVNLGKYAEIITWSDGKKSIQWEGTRGYYY